MVSENKLLDVAEFLIFDPSEIFPVSALYKVPLTPEWKQTSDYEYFASYKIK